MGKMRFMRWVLFFLLFVVPAASAASAPAERTVSVSQIVSHPALDSMQRGFRDYFETVGRPVKYHVHIAGGDPEQNQVIAEKIAQESPDLVLAISTPSAQACAQTIKDTVILFTGITDPVGAGLVEALDRPGKWITGMTDMSPVDRQIKVIKELQPGLKKIGVLFNPQEDNSVSIVQRVQQEAKAQGLEVVEARASGPGEVEAAARSLVGRCDAVYVPTDNTVVAEIEAVAKMFGQNRLPLYSADVDSVPRGAVVALAVDYYKMGRQTGAMAERIFNGESPANMPVETLEELQIHLNIKAAEIMGVELPVQLLDAADVIYDSFPD